MAGYLFLPLAEAIIFAMIASFILSRTLVPTMAAYLLRGQVEAHKHGHKANPGPFTRFQRASNTASTASGLTTGSADQVVARRGRFITIFAAVSFASLGLITFLGRDFFPSIKSGEIDMHMRAPVGTRLEEASQLAVLVNASIRKILPGKVTNVLDNCGLPASGTNEAYNSTGTIGPQDCDITISLKSDRSPVDDYRFKLRRQLPQLFPGTAFTFLPGDITAKILNFGLPAPIDVQIAGRGQAANFAYAQALVARIRRIPGIADVNIQQVLQSAYAEDLGVALLRVGHRTD